MIRTDEFIQALQTKLNTIITTYFEEAPSSAILPYALFQNASVRSDDNSETTLIDVAIYQKDGPTLQVETILKNIKNGLDRSSINVSGKFSSYLYFESSDNVRDQDTDLISRRATFTARIFYL